MGVTTNAVSGKRRSPIRATITSAGVLVAHRGTRRPVTVRFCQIGATFATPAAFAYDRANSTSTNMLLYSNAAGGVDTIVEPVWGNE